MKKIYNDVISTGMTGLDALLEGGFRNGNLNVIAAGPGMGKTTFATQFAAYIAKSGKRVCFFSLEMPNYQVKERLAKQGNADVPIIVDDASAITPKYIRKKLVTEEADVAIIDYIGLISPNKKRKISRIKEVSEIVFELKEIAKELDIPIIFLAFLSLNNGKKPKLNDLPLEIEKDASVVLFLHRGAHYCGVNSSDTEIIIGKNQYGYSGTIEATFDLERQVFLEKEL